jgi:hypothetical protein
MDENKSPNKEQWCILLEITQLQSDWTKSQLSFLQSSTSYPLLWCYSLSCSMSELVLPSLWCLRSLQGRGGILDTSDLPPKGVRNTVMPLIL